LTQNCFGKQLY